MISLPRPRRPDLPKQDSLLLPSLRDELVEGRLAYHVTGIAGHLDWSAILAIYKNMTELQGNPPQGH